MNSRFKELALQANMEYNVFLPDAWTGESIDLDKFAELIIQECLELGKELQTQTTTNGSDDYNLGREMGIEVFMNQIKKNFGIE